MDIPQTQNKPAHLINATSHHQLHYKHPGHSASEPEPGRWPLQTVDDNAATARQLAALQARRITLKQPAGYNQNDGRQRNLPATYHPSPHRRRGLDDSGFPIDQSSQLYEDEQLTYERRTRSYRDTTSEIISLYASRNALAHGSTVARSDDDGSSCTSLSRYPASQRHVHSSNSHLKSTNWSKSRTPAPYPTRLRRPGTSVTSPKMDVVRTTDYGHMAEYERAPQKSAPNLYKASLANNQRRAPPLSLRPEMNKSSCSLPSRYSPGPNHYRTASGRARTPSSTVSWASRPSDRYMGSTDQSTRSASLTSIVEMYQRPMTASSTRPAIRPGGTLFYDYSEEFNNVGCEAASETAMPLSPVPQRAGGVSKPVILRQDSEIKLHGALNSASIPETTGFAYRGGYNRHDSSTDESFDSYLQGSHDDSIEEIERVIANAISNAAADKLKAATERLKAYPDNFRYRQEAAPSEPLNASIGGRRLPATERQYGIKPATGNIGISTATRRASQASINRNAIALDPAFADFTSLLSSFERLAKSPFSRLSDEDDTDERASKRSSRISTMQTLDEMETVEMPYKKRHRRNVVTAQVTTPAPSISESVTEQPPSSDEDTLILKPEPLSPNHQKKAQHELRQKFMKALPPLPAELVLGAHHAPAIGHFSSKRSRNDSGISQVRSTPTRSRISRSNSPGKLRLRVRTPSLPGDTDAVVSPFGTRAARRSADEDAANPSSKPPPKLRLKISRNQLGHGLSTQTGSVIRNNRLKQCNALADVAPPPRLDITHRPDGKDQKTGYKENTGTKRATEVCSDEKCSLGESCRPSDQFNLSYPPTPVEATAGILPGRGSPRGSVDELQTVQSEAGDLVSRRIKPKFSFLRLRSATSAAPTMLIKSTPCAACNEADLDSKVAGRDVPSIVSSRFEATANKNLPRSISVKSERVGNRVKRWATDAKRVVRSYVRRTLVRSPKSTHL